MRAQLSRSQRPICSHTGVSVNTPALAGDAWETPHMTISVEPFDPATAPESVFRGAHEAYLDLERDFFPNDPLTPFEFHLHNWRSKPSLHRSDVRLVAKLADEVVSVCHVAIWNDHADIGLITPAVRRDMRGKGVGTALFADSLDALESHGRTKLIVDVPIGSPLEPTAQRYGLERALTEKINQLQVSDIDWGLMDSWIEAASVKAPDYELLWMRPPYPEEHIESWCRISDSMNDAPNEDLDLEDTVMTPEKWRSIESNLTHRGWDVHAAVAVHKPTGDFAGMTTLMYQRFHPEIAMQDDTVVHPDHRGRGLGRLLKASMAKEFLTKYPEVTRINTGNAGSNVPMLRINDEMGFNAILEISAWQGLIADARAALPNNG